MQWRILVLHLCVWLGFCIPKHVRLVTELQDLLAIVASAEDSSWKAFLRAPPFQMLADHFLSLPSGKGFAVNIGARDGRDHDPVYPLFEKGYAGL